MKPKSERVSLGPQQTLFAETPPGKDPPSISFRVPGRLPSWNQILGLEHWARYQLKERIQVAFASALRASAKDFSMRTTSARNIMWTAADTLDSYRETLRAKRRLKLLSKKLSQEPKKKRSLKSGPVKPLPF